MFDIGWMEMMVVAVVMIVIIGPKELPGVLHTMGRWIGRVRAMARSFQEGIEDMAQESGLDEVRRQIDSASHYDIGGEISNSIDPGGEMRKDLTYEGPEDTAKATEAGEKSETPERRKKPRKKKRKPQADNGSPTDAKTKTAGTEPADSASPVAGDQVAGDKP